MKIIVTGAAGLIGRVVAAHLLDLGHEVVGVGIDRGVLDIRAEWMGVDLARSESIDWAGVGADAVAHLAAIPSPGAVSAAALLANNSLATFSVLEAAGCAGIPRAVIASSISAYGIVWAPGPRPSVPRIPLSEVDALQPIDEYALSKEHDEATARMMAKRHGMSVACLRLPNVSSLETAAVRRRQVDADPSVAHRELWAYLTLSDAARGFECALFAEFSECVVANMVAPTSLFSRDVRPLVTRFYPEANNALPRGRSQACYAGEVARDVLGFEAIELLEEENP